jgi:hypothetical protein
VSAACSLCDLSFDHGRLQPRGRDGWNPAARRDRLGRRLFVLAVAQPLLDLLGRNAEFFLVRAAPPLDILSVALVLTIAIPLLAGLAIVALRKVYEPTGRVVHGLVLAALGGVLALQIIELTPLAGHVEIALGVTAGILLAVAFYRYATLRSVARLAAIAQPAQVRRAIRPPS